MSDEMVAKRISMHVHERAATCGVHGAHTERGMQFMAGSPIRMVRATWRRDSRQSEQEVIDTLCALDLLVIDEVGVQRGTDDEQIILFDVIDRRYADLRPTIIITNLNGAAFAEVIGPRIMDRLRERAVFVPFNWASYRGRV